MRASVTYGSLATGGGTPLPIDYHTKMYGKIVDCYGNPLYGFLLEDAQRLPPNQPMRIGGVGSCIASLRLGDNLVSTTDKAKVQR